MLARKNRLSESQDFKRVETDGTIYQSQNFGLAYFDRKDEEPSRYGFVVSTKIAKDAVDRNRFKRAMSESVRTSGTDLKSGFDVVFLAKTSIVKSPTSDIMKEVRVALKGSKLLK
ncbi:MAG TPA: ribonuclease P protein component [Patescibacteria group bacterium]|nr:ribonuclease P protein component [Patescibacteria group bacterium]